MYNENIGLINIVRECCVMKLRELKEIINRIPEKYLDLEAVNYDNVDETILEIDVVELVRNNYELCVSLSHSSKHSEYLPEDYDEFDSIAYGK